MYSPTRRIEYVDSLRGLAALIVLLMHSLGAFAWPAAYFDFINLPFINIIFDGKAAVAMFFVLSGFVLSRPYVTTDGENRRQIFLPTFYLRRFTRIWLPWFSAFMISAAAQHFYSRNIATEPPVSSWINDMWRGLLSWNHFWRQCFFLLHDANVQLLNQDWSLGVELKGSVLIPLFVFLIYGWRQAWLAVVALALFFGLPIGSYYVAFILGVLVARYADGILQQSHQRQIPIGPMALLAGICLYQGRHIGADLLGWQKFNNTCWLVTTVGCALILLGTMAMPRVQAALNHRLPVFLGRISYSVYLLQFIIIICLLPICLRFLNFCGLVQPAILLPLTLLLSVLATVACSTAHFHLVEKPCIELGHRLTLTVQRWFSKTTKA